MLPFVLLVEELPIHGQPVPVRIERRELVPQRGRGVRPNDEDLRAFPVRIRCKRSEKRARPAEFRTIT